MPKRKVLATTTRGIARKIANVDGKFAGLSQTELEKALDLFVTLEVACELAGYKSLSMQVRRNSMRKVHSERAKKRNQRKDVN